MHADRDRNDDFYSKKSKKPDQYYHPSQHQQKSEKGRYDRQPYDNRQPPRQGSEPRAAGGGNSYSNQDSMKPSYANSDRNRDTRSSEPGGNHYEQRNKPPSGQGPRINNSAFQRLPLNIDSLPPRLKRKYLIEAGLPESLADKPIMQEMTQQSYSNTLPSGRGRNNRYDQQNYHHQNSYQNSYQSKYSNNNNSQGYQQAEQHENNYRSITPPPPKGARPQHKPHQETKPPPPSRTSDWKPNDIAKRESSPPNTKTSFNSDTNFDWCEDVMNSQSLPPEINSAPNFQQVQQKNYDDNNRHRNRRRRNRR